MHPNRSKSNFANKQQMPVREMALLQNLFEHSMPNLCLMMLGLRVLIRIDLHLSQLQYRYALLSIGGCTCLTITHASQHQAGRPIIQRNANVCWKQKQEKANPDLRATAEGDAIVDVALQESGGQVGTAGQPVDNLHAVHAHIHACQHVQPCLPYWPMHKPRQHLYSMSMLAASCCRL